MSDSQDKKGNHPQPPQTTADNSKDQPPKRLSQREREGKSWLRQLRLLPSDILEQCIRRLQCGITQPDLAAAPVAAGVGGLEEFVQRAHDSLDEQLAPIMQMVAALRRKPKPEPVTTPEKQ